MPGCNVLILALERDIAFDDHAVKLAAAGIQWCLCTYIGV